MTTTKMFRAAALPLVSAGCMIALFPNPAQAQDDTKRVRVSVGPELTPAYPGASKHSLSPFFDVDVADAGEPFAHEAAEESFGLPLIDLGDISIGPILSFTGKRDAADTTPGLREIGTTVEVGGSVTATISPQFYVFAELARGIGGHDAWTGQAGADYVIRSGDEWLVSLGPRTTYGSGKHARAYFGVTPQESVATGLQALDAGGGIESVGVTSSTTVALGRRWGVSAYARYDRLVGDARRSPVVAAFGDRDQFSGGIAIDYTFDWNRN